MASEEPTKSKSTTTSRATSLSVPKETPGNNSSVERRETRASSPAGLPSELALKYITQVGRITSLKALLGSLPKCAPNTSFEELKVYSTQVEEIHRAFAKDHAYFEAVWPAAHLNHEYFTNTVHVTETQLCLQIKLKLGKLRQELEPFLPQPTHHSQTTPGNLPELSIPTFSGDYLEWPAYSELFTAIIGSSKLLTDIEKLQYLRSSLKGEPAQKVEALPLKGASFQPAWALLSERYQNKRILIQTQLDKLFSAQPLTTKSATALTQLISKVEEAHTALNSLGVSENLGDHILVHYVARSLDRNTREAWETSLGSSQEYPTFRQIREFVSGKARALERAEPVKTHTTTHAQPTKKHSHSTTLRASSNQVTQSANPQQKQFQCDCCGADHFIVVCPKFRSMTVSERRKIVANNALCYNCCGRHSSANCKSPHKCKQCGIPHHAMLHVPTQKPTHSQPYSENLPSTSSQPQ